MELSVVQKVDGKRYRITAPYTLDLRIERGDPGSNTSKLITDLIPGTPIVEPATTLVGVAAPDISHVQSAESMLGRTADVVRVYHDPKDTLLLKPLLDPKALFALAGGRRLLVSFTAPWADVAAGKLDARLAGYAAEADKADPTGELIDVCFGHEPDTYGQGQDPAEFKMATARAAALFHKNPGRRMVLLLQANTYRVGAWNKWWPGAGVIDVLGADGYNWLGMRAGAGPSTPGQVFGPFIDVAATLSVPTVVGEVNTGGTDEERAAWLPLAWALFTRSFVEYAVVFLVLADNGTHDWRIPTGSAAASALASIGAL